MDVRSRITYRRIWSLFSWNQLLQNILILLVLCNCDLKNIFAGISQKNSFHGLPLPSLPHKITYIQTVLRQKCSQIWFFCCRFFPHASSDSWVRQNRCTWHPTIRRYGIQPDVCDKITPNDDGDQKFGGLFSFRYLCSWLWQYHSPSYLKDKTFLVEEIRIMCSCK